MSSLSFEQLFLTAFLLLLLGESLWYFGKDAFWKTVTLPPFTLPLISRVKKKDVCAALFCSRSQHQCCNSFPFGGTLNVCSGVCWSHYGTVWFAYGPHRARDRARLALIMSKCSLVFWV